MTDPIDVLLQRFHMLDEDGFLLHPDHPNITRMTQRMFKLLELQQSGIALSDLTKVELKSLQRVYDYYNEVLEEEANDMDYEEEEEEEEDDFDSEEFTSDDDE